MKNNFKLWLLAITSIFTIFSCKENKQNKKETTSNGIRISGKIANNTSKILTITSDGKQENAKIEVNEKGEFDADLELPERFYYLMDEKFNTVGTYLESGVKLHIQYDENKMAETLKMSGKNIEKSKYMNERVQAFLDFGKKHSQKFFDYSPEQFWKASQDYKTKSLSVLEKYKSSFTAQFLKLQKGDIHYSHYAFIDQYADAYKGEALPDYFVKALKDYDLNDEGLYKISDAYRMFLYNKFAIYNNKVNKGEIGEPILDYIAKTIDNGYIKSRELQTWWSLGINRVKDKNALYDKFMALSTDKSVQAEVRKKYDKISKFFEGNPSPMFTNYEQFGGGRVSLKDFKGKYVFIDFWATWCSPCIKEFPYINKLEKTYHNKNIVFVGISLDKTAVKNNWKKTIKKHNLKGIQLLADNALKSQFAKDYNITTIPRFILIDPKGNIVSSNAPKPSNEKAIKELLDRADL